MAPATQRNVEMELLYGVVIICVPPLIDRVKA
jgi:hypothetical protein